MHTLCLLGDNRRFPFRVGFFSPAHKHFHLLSYMTDTRLDTVFLSMLTCCTGTGRWRLLQVRPPRDSPDFKVNLPLLLARLMILHRSVFPRVDDAEFLQHFDLPQPSGAVFEPG